MKSFNAPGIATRTALFIAAPMLLLVIVSSNAFSLQLPSVDPSAEAQKKDQADASGQAQSPSGQASPQAPATPPRQKRIDCQHPADPHRRHMGCKDEAYDWDETLSHDWTGIRSKMRQLGITPALSYTGVLQTNATGQPHQVWSFAGQLVAALDVDLEKLLRIQGMSANVGGSWGTGSNLSGSLNTLFPVNSLYAPTYYLGEMYLQQTLLNKSLTLVAGRLAAANTFATLPVFTNYISYGVNPNPYPLGRNDITFFGPPTGAEWGTQAIYNVTPVIQVSAGLFNTNLNSANGANHGTDFALQQGNKGALVVAQVSYFPHTLLGDQGKQGEYTLGFLTNNNSLPSVSGSKTESGGYTGMFALGQEVVYQPDGPGTSRGLTVWGSWAYNAKPLVSVLPLFWGAGASYQGLIPARKNDVLSAGWIYGQVSNYIPGTSAELVLEANYRLAFGRFLAITPDFQYIWNPGGVSAPGIAVAGVQASVVF